MRRSVAPVRDLAQQRQHGLDLDVVQVRGGLVRKHERGVERNRPCDGHALLLPTERSPGR